VVVDTNFLKILVTIAGVKFPTFTLTIQYCKSENKGMQLFFYATLMRYNSTDMVNAKRYK